MTDRASPSLPTLPDAPGSAPPSRLLRRWRKLRSDPVRFFLDSRVPLLGPLGLAAFGLGLLGPPRQILGPRPHPPRPAVFRLRPGHREGDLILQNGPAPGAWLRLEAPEPILLALADVAIGIAAPGAGDGMLMQRPLAVATTALKALYVMVPPETAVLTLIAGHDAPLPDSEEAEIVWIAVPQRRVWRHLRDSGLTVRDAARRLDLHLRAWSDLTLQEESYRRWRQRHDWATLPDAAQAASLAARLIARPVFSLILSPDPDRPQALLRSIESLTRQSWPHWRAWVLNGEDSVGALDPGSRVQALPAGSWGLPLPPAEGSRDGAWLMLLAAGDRLAPHALLLMAQAAADAETAVLVLHGDHDHADSTGRRFGPIFKGMVNREAMRARPDLGPALALRRQPIEALGGGHRLPPAAAFHDLALRALEVGGETALCHLPQILLHRDEARPDPMQDPTEREGLRLAVAAHLRRCRVPATAQVLLPPVWGAIPQIRVGYALPDPPPKVSILIPTRDALPLLTQVVTGLLEQTDYPDLEVLILDNGSVEPATIAWIRATLARDPRVRALRDNGPFNFARLNNRGAAAARGALLCLLNNDIEVVQRGWLTELVRLAVQPGMGAVGARLLYPNGAIQHAGVVTGLGHVAGHAHRHLPAEAPGYDRRAFLPQDCAAVTAACLVTPRRVWQKLGGMDETNLAVAYNDVDYCLRARDQGLRVVLTPWAELIHHESATRGRDDDPVKAERLRTEIAWMHQRHPGWLAQDPFYSPHLDRRAENFRLSAEPRIPSPFKG